MALEGIYSVAERLLEIIDRLGPGNLASSVGVVNTDAGLVFAQIGAVCPRRNQIDSPIRVCADETPDGHILDRTTWLVGLRRNQVTLGNELLAQAHEALRDGLTGRARVL